MSPELPKPVRPGHIDCYEAEFPAEDPQSAAAYARVIAPSFEFDVPAEAAGQPFSARAEVFFLPDATVSRASNTAGRFRRTMATIAAQRTDQILVFTYTSGHFDLTTGGERRRVEAGDIAFIDLAQEAMIEAPEVANIGVAISRTRLEGRMPFLGAAHGFVRRRDALGRMLTAMLEQIAALGPELTLVDARAVSEAVIELAAACLEPLTRRQHESSRNLVSLVSIKAFIEQQLLEPGLGPQMLLEEFGITRSTLYRLFEPLGGVSGYILSRKLQHAFRVLSDTQRPRVRISQLAAELGFSHASAFTRVFKESFGLPPTMVQTLADQSRPPEVPLVTSTEPMQYFRPVGGE